MSLSDSMHPTVSAQGNPAKAPEAQKTAKAQQQISARQIVRPVEILKGVRSIAAFLGVSQAEVLRLESMGAPMRRKNNIIRAEKAELWYWWKQV